MMPRIAGHKLLVRHTMQFNPRYAGIEPDPTQRFDHLRDRLLTQSESSGIKTAHAHFLTKRKSNGDVLNFWRLSFIRVHTITTFDEEEEVEKGEIPGNESHAQKRRPQEQRRSSLCHRTA